ncbi:MAG: AbiH family protein [Bacteroidales bacterium]|nr:AbiH family protein [Bacteroidales bacterium]
MILIGNGFDLAHGLKTSYADFINWYWGEWSKRLMVEKKIQRRG